MSCETLISDELQELNGVDSVTVCHKKQEAEVTHSEGFSEKDAHAIVKKLGYQVGDDVQLLKTTKKQWFISLLIVVGLYLAFKGFSSLGLFDWLLIDPTNITYGVAFLIGIVASMSTCLAIVGAVIISFAAKYKSKGTFYEANIKPHLMFHVGRLVTFFILGGLLGIIGSWVNFSGQFMGVFTVLIAIVLAWLGLNILGVVPSLSTIGIRMPKGMTSHWSNLKKSDHPLAPIILGGFTFFLPCGFTQSMQLFAVSSGSFWAGGWTLFLFALGTVPILLTLGGAASRFSHDKSVVFKKVIGFIVILFALYTLSSGLAIAGFSLDVGGDKGETVVSSDYQEIVMEVNFQGYSPNVFYLEKDVPVRWIVRVKQMSGCTNEIISPELKIKRKLVVGDNLIEFTPSKAGTIGFSCWMGMVRGKFIVQDKVSNNNGPIPAASAQEIVPTTSGTTCSGDGSCGGGCGSTSCGCGARQ